MRWPVWMLMAAVTAANVTVAALVSHQPPSVSATSGKSMAITFDDLPKSNGLDDLEGARRTTESILRVLKTHRAPAVAFVNEGKLYSGPTMVPERAALLQAWVDAGVPLGNHTYSHLDLNDVPLAKYQDDVVRGERTITRLMRGTAPASAPRWFRHPYTHTGPTQEVKAGLEKFLARRGYRIAPFTIENSDWIFSAAYAKAKRSGDEALAAKVREAYLAYTDTMLDWFETISKETFGREIPQILLIHSNDLHTDALDALLTRIERRGYRWVTLADAMKDAAYSTPDEFVGTSGPSWLHRWRVSRKLPSRLRDEPEPPQWVAAAGVAPQSSFDVVIRGGRVIDPETGLDGVRSVGISGGRITAVSTDALTAPVTIDAAGLVVAPGFIDLHTHVNDAATYRLAAMQGVTSALDLEIGAPDVAAFYSARQGRSPINFGTSASHPWSRLRAFGTQPSGSAIVPATGREMESVAGDGERRALRARLEQELAAGALGIGMGLVYTPGATRAEAIEMFRIAEAHRVPVFVHVRSSGKIEPGSSIESVGEVIAAAAVTGAPLHIVHINSSCLADVAECLRMIAGARARGLDVTVEGYPYGAGMTDLKSAVFNPGWQQRLGITERELSIPETGEQLTAATFARYRAMAEPRLVLIQSNPDAIVDAVITDPLTMVASDAVMQNGKGHPRAAGAFARVLARYVRERRTLSLSDAIRKMSLMPAQRLSAARKGRIQPGADADIVIFDLATVADRATYASPAEPAVGVRHVLVNGVAVVKDGAFVDGVPPGRPLRRER